jgi:hypothetical protein
LSAAADRPASAAPDAPSREFEPLTTEALEALAALEAQAPDHLKASLRFGHVLSTAKRTMRGSYNAWCRTDLKRSPSWCSAYRRLFESQANLEPALAWAAATNHRWANCRSVERLLKLIEDHKKATGTAPENPRRKPAGLSNLARLEKRLSGCEHAFVALCDAVAPFWVGRAKFLAGSAGSSPEKALAQLALRIHACAISDATPTCSALQVESVGTNPDQLPVEGEADVARLN